jgi:hypothetical protein
MAALGEGAVAEEAWVGVRGWDGSGRGAIRQQIVIFIFVHKLRCSEKGWV